MPRGVKRQPERPQKFTDESCSHLRCVALTTKGRQCGGRRYALANQSLCHEHWVRMKLGGEELQTVQV